MIYLSTQCFPPDLGGIQTYLYSVASELVARGREVCVFADALRGEDTKPFDSAQPFPVHRFGGFKPIRRRKKASQLARMMSSTTENVVLCDTWKSLEHIPASTCKQAKVICLAHGMEFPSGSDQNKKLRVQKAFAKADVILANSHFTANRMVDYLPDGKVAEILLPGISVPLETGSEIQSRVQAKKAQCDPALLTISRIEARKGHDKIIAAIVRLKQRYPNIHYYVIGNGPDKERLEGLVADADIKQYVTFLGSVTEQEKTAWLSAVDIFVMPSRAEGNSVEGFGLVYLEAAYFGKPSLAGEVGGAGDAVVHGETGLLCDSTSVDSVVAGLSELLDENSRKSMGAAAQARVKAELLWPKVIDRLEAYF